MADIPSVGRVSRADRDRFAVLCDAREYPAMLRGVFFTEDSERPVVGDYVEFTVIGEEAVIERLLPRKTVFKRADQSGHAAGFVKTMQEQVMAANFDYVFILTSLNDDYSLNRIARYVAITLEGGGVPIVLLTKADLCPDVTPYLEEVSALSEKVRVHAISTYTGEGLDALREYLQPEKVIVLLGSSGVGKSTLVNKLAGREIMKTASIREKDSKGRHTTTARHLFVLDGTVLIDTPGMREMGLMNVDGGVASAFSDVEELISRCRFPDCSHKNEPGCAVRAALEDGTLSERRWKMYCGMLSESRKNAHMKEIAVQRKKLKKQEFRRKGL